MGLFGIGGPKPSPEPSKPSEPSEPKKFTPEEINQLTARASEKTTTKESRAILETMAQVDDAATRRFAQEKLNNLGGLSQQEKRPKSGGNGN